MYIYLLIQTLQCEQKHTKKPFADFYLTSQSTTSLPWMTMMPLQMSFQSHARKFSCTSFHIGGFLFVRYGHKASCDVLAAYFWFCWLLILFLLHHLFCLALSSLWLGKRGLVYMLLSISELVHLYAPTFVFAHLALWLKVLCDSWCLPFVIIIAVLWQTTI